MSNHQKVKSHTLQKLVMVPIMLTLLLKYLLHALSTLSERVMVMIIVVMLLVFTPRVVHEDLRSELKVLIVKFPNQNLNLKVVKVKVYFLKK